MDSENYEAGDLVHFDNEKTVGLVLRVEDGTPIVKRWQCVLGINPSKLSRPKFAVGMWVRRGGHETFRISRIKGDRFWTNARIKDGKFCLWRGEDWTKLYNAWKPIATPEAAKKIEEDLVKNEYLAGDLVCFQGSKPFPMTHIDDKGMIHFNWSSTGVKNDAADFPSRITRPEFAVGMWVRPRTGYGTPGPKRIGTITADRLGFDAHVSKRPGREGTIMEQPGGSTTVDKTCWFPVVAPDAPEPKKRDETVSENYRVGDLVRLVSRGPERFVVTDAGMGKPRAEMCLRAVVGIKLLRKVSELNLERATLRRGDWVRHFNPGVLRRRRIIGAGPETLHFDREETVAGKFEPVFCSVATKFWFPVEPPATCRSRVETLEEDLWTMREEANRLADELQKAKTEHERALGLYEVACRCRDRDREANVCLKAEAHDLSERLIEKQDEAEALRANLVALRQFGIYSVSDAEHLFKRLQRLKSVSKTRVVM